MACIKIKTYDNEQKKHVVRNFPLGEISGEIDLKKVSSVIQNLSEKEKGELVELLRSPISQKITETMLKQNKFVSNTSLKELQDKYPSLKKYKIPINLHSYFTLIETSKAILNSKIKSGRIVKEDGEEIFIITNQWDAEKLFKYLYFKSNLSNFVKGNKLDKKLLKYEQDLKIIADHYKLSIEQLLLNFLDNKRDYISFKENDKIYSAQHIINNVLHTIYEEYDFKNKSSLQLDLENIKLPSNNYEKWVIPKNNLYELLTVYVDNFKEKYTLDGFKKLNKKELNDILHKLFLQDANLIKCNLSSINDYDVTIALNIYSSIGDIYNFGYDSEYFFNPISEYKDGYYKGFYIYEYFNKELNKKHYAISRSIISPNSFMKTFNSLEDALKNINENTDTLYECGLWSIKQYKNIPRRCNIEMKNVNVGSIVTTLDLELPKNYMYKYFPENIKNLFQNNLENFYNKLDFIENIRELDSPEKATAFIFLMYDNIDRTKDFFSQITNDAANIIINKINNSPKISYLVESKFDNQCYLKLLRHEEVDLQPSGTFKEKNVSDYFIQNLTDAITYFEEKFGIKIHGLSKSELEEFSKEHELNLENKLSSIKGFVYNGEIYINKSSAKMSDLYHELSHILLGIVKVKDKNLYDKIIDTYKSNSNFMNKFKEHEAIYKHYATDDIIEETIVDILADKIVYKDLGDAGFNGDHIMKLFNELFNDVNIFTSNIPDNGLGFGKTINTLLNENSNKIQRNMKISNLIRNYIEEGKIKDTCKLDLL